MAHLQSLFSTVGNLSSFWDFLLPSCRADLNNDRDRDRNKRQKHRYR